VTTVPAASVAVLPGGERRKWILFELGGQTCGLPILQAREILAGYRFTPLPHLPEVCRGVISVRGRPVPVVDLRRRLELPPAASSPASRVIVLEQEADPVGVEVDRVLRLAVVEASAVRAPPALGAAEGPAYLSGVLELDGGRFALLLDVQRILTSPERLALREWAEGVRREAPAAPEETKR
jgi:purine-binding chemotaxis protein CheW